MKPRLFQCLVQFERPEGMTVRQAVHYVSDAVECWGGHETIEVHIDAADLEVRNVVPRKRLRRTPRK